MNVEVMFSVQGPAAIAGAHTNNNTYLYPVLNSRVTLRELELHDNVGRFARLVPDGTGVVAGYGAGFYNVVSADDRDTVLARAHASAQAGHLTVRATLRGTCYSLFYQILDHMSYAAGNNNNFADPPNQGAITGTYAAVQNNLLDPNPADTAWTVTYNAAQWDLPALNADVVGYWYRDADWMRFSLRLSAATCGLGAADQMVMLRYFLSSDWRGLLDAPADANVGTWTQNLKEFLLRFVPLTRGRRLMDGAQALGLAASGTALGNAGLNDTQRQQQVLTAIRNEVDRFLITSNPWGEPTNGAGYPDQIHIALVAQYDANWDAMPLKLIRDLALIDNILDRDQYNEMVSQTGIANCGEHSQVTFSVIQRLMVQDPATAALLRVVVRTGYANVDHCFCVGGEEPVEIINARVHVAGHTVAQGQRRLVWDAWAAWLPGGNGHGRQGWLCDPYLAVGQIATTLDELQNAWLRVRQWMFWYNEMHPPFAMAPAPRVDHDDNAHATHVHVAGYCAASPTVTAGGAAPAVGSIAGGTQVTITGTHFETRPLRVVFGEGGTAVNATNVRVPAGNQIVCDTAAHAAGAVRVTVHNNANQRGTRQNVFTYSRPPVITGVVDNAGNNFGSSAGGDNITINGTDFVNGGGLAVTFGAAAPVPGVFVNANRLTCVTPAHAAGAGVNVVVRNPDGVRSAAAAFTFLDPPTVANVAAPNGSTAGGLGVTVNGAHFVAGGALSVTFGGAAPVAGVFVLHNQLTCVTPPYVGPGAVAVQVTNGNGMVGPATPNAFTYVAPVIVALPVVVAMPVLGAAHDGRDAGIDQEGADRGGKRRG